LRRFHLPHHNMMLKERKPQFQHRLYIKFGLIKVIASISEEFPRVYNNEFQKFTYQLKRFVTIPPIGILNGIMASKSKRMRQKENPRHMTDTRHD
jgi:hypothetical protein